MGYGYYEINRPNGAPMKRGYSVPCTCHARGCTERIDRGMAYLCYHCTWYYCGKHLTAAYGADDEAIEVECFAGVSTQVCERCSRELEAQACSHEAAVS